MFEFFIALFGGLFYLCKYCNEKFKEASFDERQMTYRAIRNSIESRYVLNDEAEREVKNFVSSGEHYDEICSLFAEEFRYVFGEDWKEKLIIPKLLFPIKCTCSKKITPFPLPMLPSVHSTWVYHLLLAKQGKIDHTVPGFGYPIGGIKDKDMCVKFAECIEKQLINAGVKDIRLVLELDNICCTIRRTPSDVCGGNIKIESLCCYPTHRLW